MNSNGVSPAFFASYERTEGYNSNWGWLNHTAVYDPWENLIWVGVGDGQDTQMIFISGDMGNTFHRVSQAGYCEFQPTTIIPLRDAVLFVSDQRLTGVARYLRPVGGTRVGQELFFDYPFILAEKWGKEELSEVPIASNYVIDYEKSIAYFSWAVVSSAFSGRVDDALNYGNVYTSDGHEIKEIYKRNEITQQNVYGIYGDPSHDNKLAVKHVHSTHAFDVIDVSETWAK